MVEADDFLVRRSAASDLDNLYELVLESTDGKTKISRQEFGEDLFGIRREQVKCAGDDCTYYDLTLDINRIWSNRPTCQSFVAENRGELVGYVIFHYYYSPWLGHSFFIDDIYIRESHRRQGIAKKLLLEVTQLGRLENMKKLIFNSKRVPPELMKAIQNYVVSMRDDTTDWGVIRIKFRDE